VPFRATLCQTGEPPGAHMRADPPTRVCAPPRGRYALEVFQSIPDIEIKVQYRE